MLWNFQSCSRNKPWMENISGSDFPAWVYSPQRSFLYTTNMAPQQQPGEMVDIKNEQLALVDTQENKPEIMGFFFFSILVSVSLLHASVCVCVLSAKSQSKQKQAFINPFLNTHQLLILSRQKARDWKSLYFHTFLLQMPFAEMWLTFENILVVVQSWWHLFLPLCFVIF